MKYLNIYQYILHPEENIISTEEWKAFSKDCLSLISLNYRKLKIPREDLAGNYSIVEDTFCHLLEVIHKKIHTFDPENSTFRTWINGYIKKIVLQFSNRYYPFDAKEILSSDLSKDSEVDIFELLLSIPKNELPDEKVLYQEALDSLKLALEKLPSSWYKVLYYRCFKGYSVEDTAKALNTKKERISNMLNKARERLKIHLEEMGWDIQNYKRKAN